MSLQHLNSRLPKSPTRIDNVKPVSGLSIHGKVGTANPLRLSVDNNSLSNSPSKLPPKARSYDAVNSSDAPNTSRSLLSLHGSSMSLEPASSRTGPIVVPHGFQTIKTLVYLRDDIAITSALHIPTATTMLKNEMFLMADAKAVYLWQGDKKTGTLSREDRPRGVLPTSSVHATSSPKKSPMAGLKAWTCIKAWKPAVVVIATTNLEIKILDHDLTERFTAPTSFPVLTMEYIDAVGELVVAGAGGITSWTFKTVMEQGRALYAFDETRLSIRDLAADDWIWKIRYRHRRKWLYAASGSNILIYNFNTGRRLDSIINAHSGQITGLEFIEKLETIVTCGRDGAVNLWNAQKRLIYSLKDHAGSVTSMILLNQVMVLTCSFDGSLRIWDVDHGRCTGLVETTEKWHHVDTIGGDRIASVSKHGVHIWNLTRIHEHFCTIRAKPCSIRRVESTSRSPARLLVASADGAVRLFSPVTAGSICTILPPQNDTNILDVVYDLADSRMWVLFESGAIYIQSLITNPAKIVDAWSPHVNRDVYTCMINLGLHGSKVHKIVAGLNNGQLVAIDLVTGARQFLVQAHIASVAQLVRVGSHEKKLLTCGRDGAIKLWSLEEANSPLTSTIHCMASIQLSGLVPRYMCYDSRLEMLGVIMEDFGLFTYRVSSDKFVPSQRRHGKDDDHTKQVMSISNLPTLGLFMTTSADGCIKIWDVATNSLLREIQLEEPLGAGCFSNLKGDLVVGMSQDVVHIRNSDYLPSELLRKINALNLQDDIAEHGPAFDSDITFWQDIKAEDETVVKLLQEEQVQTAEVEAQIDSELLARSVAKKVKINVLGSADELDKSSADVDLRSKHVLFLEGDDPTLRKRGSLMEDEHIRIQSVKAQFRANLAALAYLQSPALGSRRAEVEYDRDDVRRARKYKGRRGRVKPNDRVMVEKNIGGFVYNGMIVDDSQYEDFTSPDASDDEKDEADNSKNRKENDADGNSREALKEVESLTSPISTNIPATTSDYWDGFECESDDEDDGESSDSKPLLDVTGAKLGAADFFKDSFKDEKEASKLSQQHHRTIRGISSVTDIKEPPVVLVSEVVRKPQPVVKPKADPTAAAARRATIIKNLGSKIANTAPVVKDAETYLSDFTASMLNLSTLPRQNGVKRTTNVIDGNKHTTATRLPSSKFGSPRGGSKSSVSNLKKSDFRASWRTTRAHLDAKFAEKPKEAIEGVEEENISGGRFINWEDYDSEEDEGKNKTGIEEKVDREKGDFVLGVVKMLPQPELVATPAFDIPVSEEVTPQRAVEEAMTLPEPVPLFEVNTRQSPGSSGSSSKDTSSEEDEEEEERAASVSSVRQPKTKRSKSVSASRLSLSIATKSGDNLSHVTARRAPRLPPIIEPNQTPATIIASLPMAKCGTMEGGLGISPTSPSLAFSEADEKRTEELARERCKLQAMRVLNSAVVSSRNQGILELIKSNGGRNGKDGYGGGVQRGNKLAKKFEQNGKSNDAYVLADFGCSDRLANAIVFPPLPITDKLNVPKLTTLLIGLLKSGAIATQVKCDALFVLYGIYSIFKDDLPNPIDDLLLPQLSSIHDADMTVRAYAGMMLGRYGQRQHELLLGLLTLLADKEVLVRKGAALGLGRLGIATRDEMVLALAECGASFRSDVHMKRQRDYLDDLTHDLQDISLPQLRTQNRGAVAEWIRTVPKDFPEIKKKQLLNDMIF
ncbi:hypothetical protein SeMB42_g01983 [Synchytrium endobioticum]|uniref:Uncharacterized protein n=1 Tax=Synchytrium endobioticum TaxID=286115 RepID=A0A507DIX7_9FUNG|nr:hypothetical protein SeLEV6574_g05220 [Synchytrium endobioticum]TPX51215.1 hypothetical protein SeMB42_g01983 [Synchytrium endobioticum]